MGQGGVAAQLDSSFGARGGPIQAFFDSAKEPRRPIVDRAAGIYIWDGSGKRYLDASSGPVASNLGHSHPRILEAMGRQAARATFAHPGVFESEANQELGDLLALLAGPGLERAFFVSGGSEATEAAIKLARQHAVITGEARRWKVISRNPSYHGATAGALAVGGDVQAEAIFAPLLKKMPKIPAPFTYRFPENQTKESHAVYCAALLEQTIRDEGPETILAFIMEPIGGLSTGALVAEDSYYRDIHRICRTYGVLLIYDEVMSGAGRSGRFLAADYWPESRPDIVTLAKGIAAGYTPFGAVLAPASMVSVVAEAGGFNHGHTYFANPLSCAIALAVVQETVEAGLICQAARMGELLRDRLLDIQQNSPLIGDVRGRGLLMAIELVSDKTAKASLPLDLNAPRRLSAVAAKNGLLLYGRRTSNGIFGEWLMISPPLITAETEVDELDGLLRRSLADYADELTRQGVRLD